MGGRGFFHAVELDQHDALLDALLIGLGGGASGKKTSWTRLSPKSCWPASKAARTFSASWVLEIATSSMSSAERALFFAASAIWVCTRSRLPAISHQAANARPMS